MASAAPTVQIGQSAYSEASRLTKSWTWIKRFARKRTLGFIAGLFCVFVVFVAIGAGTGLLTPYDPTRVHGADRLLGVGSYSMDGTRFYILGTDEYGRDVFSRLVKGAELSLYFSLGVTTFSMTIGSTLGLMSAYFGGKFDLLLQRVVDALQTLPLLVLAVALVAILGAGIWKGFWVLAVLSIPRPLRVIRGSVLSVREELFILSAQSLGATNNRVMFRHVLPNVMAPMIVLISYAIAVTIVTEASLSFLGVGAQPPTPSWGVMLTGSGQAYFQTNPRLALLPGFAISSVVFAVNMFGDALRDELDPRMRGT
ncbi:MAG: ABC transporter permease [Chloroflexi bacterium]|nr:ABC transporter permease [Chloroflexota bacterium]